MTRNLPDVNGQHQPPSTPDGIDGMRAELVQVQKHIIELLAQLDRRPCNLRVQAGQVTVDITWADEPEFPEARPHDIRDAGAGFTKEADDEIGGDYLTSPGVGVFYHASAPGAEPFVTIGSPVRPGQQIGIIEAMKLMIPVEADRHGRIANILKANNEPVEYGEPLFELAAGEGAEADV
jgi:acetyl-CoA carboxylase biotin carboxyl carrier protein